MEQLANSGVLGAIIAVLLGAIGIGLTAIGWWLKAFIDKTAKTHAEERREWQVAFNASVNTLSKLNEGLVRTLELMTEHATESRENLRAVQMQLVEQTTLLRRVNGGRRE